MIATAIVWQALGPIRSIRRRRRWLWEAVSLLLLVAVVATGLLLISGQLQDAHELRIRIQLAYAFTTLFGWVVLTASAVALKLFPLWVWKERFEPEWGTKPVPAVSELASPVLREVSGLCLTLGVAGTVVGIVLAHQNMIAIALKVQFVGVALFVINFARMARWALLKLDYRPPRSR